VVRQVDLAALPTPDVAGRLDRLRARLDGAGCDALVVTKIESVRYLTGFTGSAAVVLVLPGSALLCTDGRYRDQVVAELDASGAAVETEIAARPDQLELVARACGATARIGLEAASVSWSLQRRLAEHLGEDRLVATDGVVEALRAVKDAGEVARIEAACDVADVAFAQVKSRLADGVTEADFAAELEAEMRARGSAETSFATIVASGPNAAMPHARPGGRAVGSGELVVVDFGATVDGYRSDMTRTLCVGELSGELAELLDAVLAAQRAGLRAVRAGATGGDVDAACRGSLAEAGYGAAFVHATGHGVGLEIHEAPALAKGSTDILEPGAVVTVEPGAYLAGRGGARIEDTVVVGAAGSRPLTKSTKDYAI
jgi:Xaa-Pro aminopeptidase